MSPFRAALRPLSPPAGAPSRWSDRPLPPYAHVPGLTPHPIKDPAGHAYGQVMVPFLAPDPLPESWPRCPPYLYGVDLFNRAFLWEAHESWEEIWHGVGRDSEVGRYVQGLVQVAAALLRLHLGTPRGARRLIAKAWVHFGTLPAEPPFMGLDLAPWRSQVEHRVASPDAPYPFLVLS